MEASHDQYQNSKLQLFPAVQQKQVLIAKSLVTYTNKNQKFVQNRK